MQIGTPKQSERINRILTPFREFSNTEATGGILLLLATVSALFWANSPWGESYTHLWESEFALEFGSQFTLSKSLLHWINDGLMAIFFLVVGLEIKREILVGELSSARQALLPIAAAIGGAVAPAIIFFSLNAGSDLSTGWGIPMATDIAFALGILALLGSRVPTAIKVFLTALAIVDDIMAVLVIAVFYTSDLALDYLLVGLGLFVLLVAANRLHIYRPAFYAVVGVGLWFAFLESGIHATVAGVLLATTIPARAPINANEFVTQGQQSLDVFRGETVLHRDVLTNWEHQSALSNLQNITSRAESPMQRIQHTLHPWVAFVIVPLFALANVGISIGSGVANTLTSTLGIGIIFGLLVGKQVGIMGASWLVVRTGAARLPPHIGFRHIYGVSWLAGIGFTMSLFITDLAFDSPEHLEAAKSGVLIASLIAGIGGWILVRRAIAPPSVPTLPVSRDLATTKEAPKLIGQGR